MTVLTRIIDQVIGILIFSYLILSIIIPSSGYLILTVLILSLFGLMIQRQLKPIDKDEKIFLFSFIAYFLFSLINIYFFKIDFRELDSVSRFVLVLPIFFYIRKSSLKANWIAYGFAFAVIVLGVGMISDKLMKITLFEFDKHLGMITLYAAIFGIASLFFLNKDRSYLSIIIFSVAGFMGVTSILLAGGRGVWIAAILSIVILNLINQNNWNKLERYLIFFIFIFLFIVSFAIPNSETYHRTKQAYNGLTEFMVKDEGERDFSKGVSVMERMEMWRAGSLIIKENPFTGVGLNNFKSNIEKLINEKKISPRIQKFKHPHGQFISAVVEKGILGLILLIFVIYSPFKVALKYIKNKRSKELIPPIAILTTTLIYFFYSFTNGIFAHQNTTLFYALIISVGFALMKRDSHQNHSSE